MLPKQIVKVKWRKDNYKHYSQKGYPFTKFGDEFEVDAEDLSKGSRIIIEYICDYCNGERQSNRFIENKVLIDHRKNNDKDCCGDKECVKIKKSESLSKVNFEQSLAKKSPHLIKEWHPCKNNNLLPSNINNGSHKKVWWICKNNHEWQAEVKSRTTLQSGCPSCQYIPSIEDSLGFNYPDLCKELHPTKNLDFDPFTVHYGTSESVWWKCLTCKNEWKTQIKQRTKVKTGCPVCSFNKKPLLENSLAFTHPELILEWDWEKNTITPYDVSHGSSKKVNWICKECRNKWSTDLRDRTKSKGTNCPTCSESKGEKKVRAILNNYILDFESQYEFDDLKGLGGGYLKFDFAIFNSVGLLELLMEYDGEYHYEKLYENDNHEITLLHDKIKNDYCEKNSIPLLRIPYWEFDNVEEIVLKELKKYKLI